MDKTYDMRLIKMERALQELRRGLPIIIGAPNGERLLCYAAETIYPDQWKPIAIHDQVVIMLTGARVSYVTGESYSGAVATPAAYYDYPALQRVIGAEEGETDLVALQKAPTRTGEQACRLAVHAELLPAMVMMPLSAGLPSAALPEDAIVTIEEEWIDSYDGLCSRHLAHKDAAPLHLEGCESARIEVFRASYTGKDHYAIIINPDRLEKAVAPLVRVHSSCYTGDVMASLSCDCGPQLRQAVTAIDADPQGGVIIYVQQEGRGIGLTNKIRCYRLQGEGLDTVEANNSLGFSDDMRDFSLAATILTQLGIRRIRLLSNNPNKAQQLEQANITVDHCVPHKVEVDLRANSYLQTKADKLGHVF